MSCGKGHLKCDGTRAETRLLLSAKWTSSFKSTGESVQSTTGSRDVRISGSNAGYIMLRGSVKSIGYPLHSPVSPSLLLPWVTVCHHISDGVYPLTLRLLMSYIYIYIYMELLVKPEMLTSNIYGPTFGNAETVSFYLLHNVSTLNQCREVSCVTFVCKHFAS